MEIKNEAIAGTLESSDVQIIISPESMGNVVHVISDVEKQFGNQIKKTVLQILEDYDIANVDVQIIDKGALDLVIKARMITAIERSLDRSEIDWSVL